VGAKGCAAVLRFFVREPKFLEDLGFFVEAGKVKFLVGELGFFVQEFASEGSLFVVQIGVTAAGITLVAVDTLIAGAGETFSELAEENILHA